MERTTDEMAATLSKLLGTMEKTAAKHDKAEDHGKDHEEKAEDKAEDKKEDKTKDHKQDKAKDHKKKASVLANVVNTLVKLADDLDSSGDMEASDLVDSALSIIMENIDGSVSKKAMFHDLEEDGDPDEYVPGEDSGEDLGMISEMEDMLQSKLDSMSPDERKAFMRWLETGHRD